VAADAHSGAKYQRGGVARVRRAFVLLLTAALGVVAAGCGGSSNNSSGSGGTTSASMCDKGSLSLVNDGRLTVGTDNPAYPPWFGGNEKAPWKVSDPRSGEGFESAVAYAVAGKLGFAKDEVKWIVVPFNTSYAPQQILSEPKEPRTQQFLQRIIEAGRL
jgi:polar amino acid transport system substrate-binding protein